MNYKEKIEKYVAGFIAYVASLVNLGSMDYESEKELRSNMVEELLTLYEQAQRDAVEGFAKWYDQDVFPEKGYAEQMVEEYLNQTKEDVNPKEGE